MSPSSLPSPPPPFRWALGLALGFLGFVAWDQSHWWRVKADYSFGWLVPVFAAYVVYDRWPAIRDRLAACAASGSPRVAGGRALVLGVFAGATLLAGTGFFLLGAFYRAGYGTSPPGTLAITLGAVSIVMAVLYFGTPSAPSTVPAASFTADARVRLVGLFLFPALVWLISAPLVSAVETQLNLLLLRKVVGVVAFVFETLGLPLEQQGNVLALPTGTVGVEDACSGIRSLTGCLFAGSFIAAVFVQGSVRKAVLVLLALGLALLTNLARSLFLTGWAYAYGPAAIEGAVHDAAGYAVLGLTVAGLVALLPLVRLRLGPQPRPAG